MDRDPLTHFVTHLLPTLGPYNQFPKVLGTSAVMNVAAKERGITVLQRERLQVFVKGGVVLGSINKMISSLVPHPLVAICGSKELTSSLLTQAGLPVPKSKLFTIQQTEEAVAYAKSLGRAVVKPQNGRSGQGVSTGLSQEITIRAALKKAQKLDPKQTVLVEEHVDGIDVRMMVIAGAVVGIAARFPPFLRGDGTSTVEQLLQSHLALRQGHADYRDVEFPPSGRMNVDGDDVPQEGQVVRLGGRAIVGGAESAELLHSDVVDPSHLEIAVAAADAIGIEMTGVDLIIPKLEEPGGAVINEMNTAPGLRMHRFPAYGQPADIAGPFLDVLLDRRLRN